MNNLMVISHDTYAQGLTAGSTTLAGIGSLAVGAMALIDKDPDSSTYNVVIDIAAASLPTSLPKLFQIVVMGNNGLKYSNIIKASNARATLLAAVAGTARVIFIGNQTSGGTTYSLNLPTLNEGDIAGIDVRDAEIPAGSLKATKSYEYQIKAGDTSANIVAALIAKVNADASRIVNAAVAYSNATDGFKLTGITAGKKFVVSPTGVLKSSSITDAGAGTALVYPQGSLAQIKDAEKVDMVERGLDNAKTYSETVTWVTDTTTGKTYNQLVIEYDVPNARPFNGGVNEKERLTIACQSDLTSADSVTNASKRSIKCINDIL